MSLAVAWHKHNICVQSNSIAEATDQLIHCHYGMKSSLPQQTVLPMDLTLGATSIQSTHHSGHVIIFSNKIRHLKWLFIYEIPPCKFFLITIGDAYWLRQKIHCTVDEGSMCLLNVSQLLQDYVAQYPRRMATSLLFSDLF